MYDEAYFHAVVDSKITKLSEAEKKNLNSFRRATSLAVFIFLT